MTRLRRDSHSAQAWAEAAGVGKRVCVEGNWRCGPLPEDRNRKTSSKRTRRYQILKETGVVSGQGRAAKAPGPGTVQSAGQIQMAEYDLSVRQGSVGLQGKEQPVRVYTSLSSLLSPEKEGNAAPLDTTDAPRAHSVK